MPALPERIYRGSSAWFDLTITDSAGDLVDINDVSDWEVVFALSGSAAAPRRLSEGGLTRNPDGTVRLAFDPDDTLALAAGIYQPWIKVTDSSGNEWPLVDGVPLLDLRSNPLQDL